MTTSSTYDPGCQRCPRLVEYLRTVRGQYPDYHARPVPAFGDPDPRLLIVGLAPGLHGANATGRPFTGDYAGILLYRTLYDFGFSTKPESHAADDGLKLKGARITNAVKCVPPQNAPLGEEVNNCNAYLHNEISALKPGTVVMALGGVAHRAVLKAVRLKLSAHPFGHGAEYPMTNGIYLIDSYHCSRYNTQTKRLTEGMFNQIFEQAVTRLHARAS